MLITSEIVKIVTQYNVKFLGIMVIKSVTWQFVKIEDWSKNSHGKS